MNILYIIFGEKIIYHIQAYLSIRSFQKQLDDSDKIFVMTTKPELYAHSGVNVIPVNDGTINDWEGEYHFFWRVKIKAIEYMIKHYPDSHLLYLDTDTFLYGQLNTIKEYLNQGLGLMHKDEGHPSQMMTKSKKMWNQIANRTYSEITLNLKHHMFNAGVVGIPKDNAQKIVATSLEICDQMLSENVERIVIEQYSLSIALYELTHLKEAERIIGHYWGNKSEWEQYAVKLLAEAYMTGSTINKEIEKLDVSTFYKIPVYIHQSSTGKRLHRQIDKYFKDKDAKYIK